MFSTGQYYSSSNGISTSNGYYSPSSKEQAAEKEVDSIINQIEDKIIENLNTFKSVLLQSFKRYLNATSDHTIKHFPGRRRIQELKDKLESTEDFNLRLLQELKEKTPKVTVLQDFLLNEIYDTYLNKETRQKMSHALFLLNASDKRYFQRTKHDQIFSLMMGVCIKFNPAPLRRAEDHEISHESKKSTESRSHSSSPAALTHESLPLLSGTDAPSERDVSDSPTARSFSIFNMTTTKSQTEENQNRRTNVATLSRN